MGWLLNIKFITGSHGKFYFKLEKIAILYNITIPIYCGNNAVSLIELSLQRSFTTQEIKLSIKDFFMFCAVLLSAKTLLLINQNDDSHETNNTVTNWHSMLVHHLVDIICLTVVVHINKFYGFLINSESWYL